MRALLLHLRSSGLHWLLLPFTALALIVVLARDRFWAGIWSETGAAGQVPAFYLGIAGAGVGAWVSSSRVRFGMVEQVAAAAISRPKAEGARFVGLLVVLVLPYMVGQLAAFAITARTFPAGVQLWFGYLVLGLILIGLATSFGWFMGLFLPPSFAAIAAALLWVAMQLWVPSSTGLAVVSGPTWEAPNPTALAIRSVAIVVFGALLVWAPPRRNEWSTSLAGTMAPVVGLLVGAGSVVLTTGIVVRDPPADPLCVPGAVEVCLWPEDEKYRPMVQSLQTQLVMLPDGFELPSRLVQYGILRSVYRYEGQLLTQLEGIDISEGNKWALARGVASSIVEETISGCNLDGIIEDQSPDAVERWLEFHLMNSSDPDYTTVGVPDDIQAAWSTAERVYTTFSERQQRAWVSNEIVAMRARHCGG